MKKTKIVKKFAYSLAGFPVVVEDVEVVVTGEGEFPLLDYEELDRRILVALATKTTKLTGNQVRFIRHSFELSLRDFAKLFHFTAPSVLKWEQRGNASTSMVWPTELFLRTKVLMHFADQETAMRNLQKLSDQTLSVAPADEQIRIAPCPPVQVSEAPLASFEVVWPELPEFGSTSFTSGITVVTGSVNYGRGSYENIPKQSRKGYPPNAFATAA